jgi:dihydropteroate synthase
MGILNLTPDSFYDGGKYRTNYISQVEKMLTEGAKIIDIGGQSTRPGAITINAEEEKKRIIPVIEEVRKKFSECIISVDTFYADVAKSAVNAGAAIVNDISGGDFDNKMFETIASLKIPYIAMHAKGTPNSMQENPVYSNITQEVCFSLAQKIKKLELLGVNDVIIDPGFGFGKTLEQNYILLKNLEHLKIIGRPILVGVSRKSMINKVLKTLPENALNGTSIVNTIALLNGAKILRVHDVKEAVEAIKIVRFMQKS